MNKKMTLVGLLGIMCLTACGPRTQGGSQTDSGSSGSSIGSTDSGSSGSSTGSTDSLSNFAQVLEKYQVENITYHSDVLFYYYPVDQTYDQKQTLQNFDVYARYTGTHYEYVSRFKGASSIYSTFALKEGVNDTTVSSSIDLQGQVQTETAKTPEGTNLTWSNSLYRNKLMDFLPENFYEDQNKFHVDSTVFGLVSDIADSATNTTSLPPQEIQDAYFTMNGESLTLTIQEKESDQVYQGYMYGRTITINFEDVGTTQLGDLQPLAEKTENANLKKALDALRASRNETISIQGYLEEAPTTAIFRSQGLLTDKDFYITEEGETPGSRVYSGLHTHTDGKIYSFASSDPNNLIGTTPSAGYTLDSVRPDFAFTHNLLTLASSEADGTEVYEMQNWSQALDHVAFDKSLSQSYLSSSDDPIRFYVSKEGTLTKITLPSMINSFDSTGTNVSKPGHWEVTYSGVGTTSTADKFTSFKTDNEVQSFTAWNQITMTTPYNSITQVEALMESVLGAGASKEIPFFLPPSIKSYEDVSYDEAGLVLFLYATNGLKATDSELANIRTLLTGAGFTEGVDEYNKTIAGQTVTVAIMGNDPSFGAEIYFG